jgi:hypothetical protein
VPTTGKDIIPLNEMPNRRGTSPAPLAIAAYNQSDNSNYEKDELDENAGPEVYQQLYDILLSAFAPNSEEERAGAYWRSSR